VIKGCKVSCGALLIGALLWHSACGSSTGGSGALTGNGDFASCDSAANGHVAPGEHACTEFIGTAVHGALSSIMEQCPASMGYTFSTTAHCPTAQPGCICLTGSASLEQHVYIYQTALQDPFQIAKALCGKAVDSCFGGLTAPAAAKK